MRPTATYEMAIGSEVHIATSGCLPAHAQRGDRGQWKYGVGKEPVAAPDKESESIYGAKLAEKL